MNPYYQDSHVTIYHGDCGEILPELGTFDLLLTDPPYGLAGHLHDRSGWFKYCPNTLKWDSETIPIELLYAFINICKKAVIWGGNYYDLPKARCWLGWDKIAINNSGDYELAWSNLNMPTRMFRHTRIEAYSSMKKEHPTQKPEKLMSWCISKAEPVATILDPFAGSGTVGRAAKDRGQKATLIEREEHYCEIASKRMAQEVFMFS